MKAIKQRKELRQKWLDYFHEVMTCQSVTAVANNRTTAPSVVSEQIKRLEKELGEILFERSRHGMKSNEAAEIVDEYYRGCRALRDYMEDCLQELRGMKRGNIYIVAPTIYADTLTKDVLIEFYSQYPGLEIRVDAVNLSRDIMNKIVGDEAHIGIVNNSPIHSDVRCCASVPIAVGMLVSKNHPLANQQKVTFAEAARYPPALPPESFSVWQMIEAAEKSEKIKLPPPSFISDSVYVRKNFAIAGCGGTFLSAFAARQEIEAGQLVALEIDHPAFNSVESCLIVRRGRPLSPAVRQLLGLIVAKLSIFSDKLTQNTLLSPSLTP